MTVLELRRLDEPGPPGPAGRPGRRGRVALFALLATFYFAVGSLLTLRYNLFDPDAPSRVANAGFVLGSRDPHLSAIGFVWNPLPSLVEIPILRLSGWWPELRTHGLAGVAQSALFMAGAAVMIDRVAVDRGVGRRWRRLAVAAFALQPMIVVYGASGMSEAAETFCIVWCVRRLILWSGTDRSADLAGAGLALGVGYLVRYEMVPAAVGAAVFVGVVAARRAGRKHLVKALADVAIVLFPIAITATVWALGGWVVDQQLFATLSSRYGNENIVRMTMREWAPRVPAGSGDWVAIAARMFGMQPFVGIACAVAVFQCARTRKLAALVPVVVIGPVLVFAAWGQSTEATFGHFRYYLLGIPLVICVALALWDPGLVRGRARKAGAALLCASVLIGYPVTVAASLDQRIGNQPLQFGFNSLFFPDRLAPQAADQVRYRRLMIDDRLLAGYLDGLRLPDGAVLTDTFTAWGVWLSSSRPKQFIITSDFDFKAALNRPWQHGVQYLLVGNPRVSEADALTVRYPTLWDDGAEMARLVYAVAGIDGQERFRLYRVTGPPPSPSLS